MRTFNRVIVGLVLTVGLAGMLTLGGCAASTATANTPTPVQNSPQSAVALAVKTVADTDQAGVQTVIALRNAGKLSQTNTTTIENWLGFIATTDKMVGGILANGQPWAQQKAAILTLLATVTAPAIATTVDPGAQVVVSQIMTLIAQIRTQVGK